MDLTELFLDLRRAKEALILISEGAVDSKKVAIETLTKLQCQWSQFGRLSDGTLTETGFTSKRTPNEELLSNV